MNDEGDNKMTSAFLEICEDLELIQVWLGPPGNPIRRTNDVAASTANVNTASSYHPYIVVLQSAYRLLSSPYPPITGSRVASTSAHANIPEAYKIRLQKNVTSIEVDLCSLSTVPATKATNIETVPA
ncbi:hypothetical protein BIW11_10215, partial [Tropilaelaps mercedesae]